MTNLAQLLETLRARALNGESYHEVEYMDYEQLERLGFKIHDEDDGRTISW